MGMSDEVAVCRLEQLFPFPYSQVSLDTSRYPNANIYWVQVIVISQIVLFYFLKHNYKFMIVSSI